MKHQLAIDGQWNIDHPDPRFHDLSDKAINAMEKRGGKDKEMAAWIRFHSLCGVAA